jgi:hypothetical protein
MRSVACVAPTPVDRRPESTKRPLEFGTAQREVPCGTRRPAAGVEPPIAECHPLPRETTGSDVGHHLIHTKQRLNRREET